MAQIQKFPFFRRLRSEASSFVIRYAGGSMRQAGRGLAFWFVPDTASIAELPMDDREAGLFIKGRSSDFQEMSVQGTLTWHIVEPQRLAERVDFTIDLRSGALTGEPVVPIEARLTGLADQAIQRYLASLPVRALLDRGLDPLLASVEAVFTDNKVLDELGITVTTVRLTRLAPPSDLERALRTPTFEALQQKADEATFERRALAVEKERAIAENELANKTELARREKALIVEETENARNRANATAEARLIEAQAQADSIRAIETAKVEAEEARLAALRDLSPAVLLSLAAREFAGKLRTIDHVTISPDLLNSLMGELRRLPIAK